MALESYGHTSSLNSDIQVGYTPFEKNGHVSLVIHNLIFSLQLIFRIIQITLGSLRFWVSVWLKAVRIKIPSDLMFVIHSSIGLSWKVCHMGMGRSSPLGQWRDQRRQNLGRRLLLTLGTLDLVFPHVFLHFQLSAEPVIALFACLYFCICLFQSDNFVLLHLSWVISVLNCQMLF